MPLTLGLEVEILARPDPTGVERALELWLTALGAARDIRVRAFSKSRGLTLPPGVDPVELPSPLPLTLWRETTLPRALARSGIDCFLSPVTAFPLRSPVPTAATVHELPWLEEGCRPSPWRERWRARVALRRADLVVAVSRATAGQCHRLAASRGLSGAPVRVVHHPFPLPAGAAAGQPRGAGPPLVVTVSAWRERKNLAALVDAFALARQHIPDAEYVIAGPTGKGRQLLAQRAASIGLGEELQLPGRVSEEELDRLLGRAVLLLHAPLSEGFGFTPLEALARGTVPLLSRRGALPEISGPAALYLDDPRDSQAMGRALAAALADREAREKCLAAAPQVLASFAPARAVDRLVEVLSEMVHR